MVRRNTKKRKWRESVRIQTKAKRSRIVQRSTKMPRRNDSVRIKVKAIRSTIHKWIAAGEKISLPKLVKEFGAVNFSKSWKIAKTIYKKTTPDWGKPKRKVSPETNTNFRKNNVRHKKSQKHPPSVQDLGIPSIREDVRHKEFQKLWPSAQDSGISSMREQHPKSNTIVAEYQEKKKKEYHKVSASLPKAKPSASSLKIELNSSVNFPESEVESTASSSEAESSTSSSEAESSTSSSEAESSTSSSESEDESSTSSAESETEISESEEEIYEVERIVRRRKKRGVWMYRVKWKGFDTKENTWEPEENLTSCKEMLENFLKNCTRRQRS